MVDLVTFQNRRILSLEASHNLLSVPDFPVHSFHLVAVAISIKSDVWNVNESRMLALISV